MRVTVTWHRQTNVHIARWIRSLPGNDPDREGLAWIVLRTIDQYLIACGGIPPESHLISGTMPPTYWWEVSNEVWVQFAVEDEPWSLRSLLRERLREITILRLQRERLNESEQ